MSVFETQLRCDINGRFAEKNQLRTFAVPRASKQPSIGAFVNHDRATQPNMPETLHDPGISHEASGACDSAQPG